MPDFIPGLQLSAHFYEEAVRPILEASFPRLRYAAALIGPGSEVLGYDTPMSTDHDWGPRLMLFLGADDFAALHAPISDTLSQKLPTRFRGYPTHFGPPDEEGVRLLEAVESGPVSHRVEVYTVQSFSEQYLGLDPTGEITARDWLTLPEQKLLTVTEGAVYHDGLGALGAARERLRYYPPDVWRYLLAWQWRRIGQGEAFVGRAGDVGDGLGSRIITARLVGDLMKLCFLMERRYAPYSKWLGTAFAALLCAPRLMPTFEAALSATTWPARERHLSAAYEAAAAMHNALGITPPLDPNVSPFHRRPFQVAHAARFADTIAATIHDETLKTLRFDAGAVDQYIDSVDVTSDTRQHRRLMALYGE